MRYDHRFSILIVVFALFFSQAVLAQSYWSRNYHRSSADAGSKVIPLSDGGFLAVGSTARYNYDSWLIRTNSNGDTIWTKILDSTEHANNVLSVNSTQFVVVGDAFRQTLNYVYLYKMNLSGDTIWTRLYNGRVPACTGLAIAPTDDHGFIITGSMVVNAGTDILLLKVDSLGNQQWLTNLHATGSTCGYGVVQAPEGGYMITAYMQSSTTDYNIWLIHTDASGSVQWGRQFGENRMDVPFGLSLIPSGGYAIFGYVSHADSSMPVIIRTNSSGIETDRHEFTMLYGWAYHGTLTADGGAVLTGFQQAASGRFLLWIGKVNSTNQEQWQRTYEREFYSQTGYGIAQTSSSDYIVTGTSGTDLLLTHLSSQGLLEVTETKPCNLPQLTTLSPCYPNPFNSTIIAPIQLTRPDRVSLQVIDLLGKVQIQLPIQQYSAGSYSIPIDCAGLSSGTYFVRLSTPTINQVQQIELVK